MHWRQRRVFLSIYSHFEYMKGESFQSVLLHVDVENKNQHSLPFLPCPGGGEGWGNIIYFQNIRDWFEGKSSIWWPNSQKFIALRRRGPAWESEWEFLKGQSQESFEFPFFEIPVWDTRTRRGCLMKEPRSTFSWDCSFQKQNSSAHFPLHPL